MTKQNTHSIFHRTRENSPKMYMEPQKTPNNQNDIEKGEQKWKNHAP